jgi:hypothetical protein
MDIVSVFCDVDDFCSRFEPAWRQHQIAMAGEQRPLCLRAGPPTGRQFIDSWPSWVCHHRRLRSPGVFDGRPEQRRLVLTASNCIWSLRN